MPKKTTLQKVQDLDILRKEEASLEFLVPEIVRQWGVVAGTPASEEPKLLQAEYAALAHMVADLLGLVGITEVSTEAVEHASKRWAARINPWVSIGTRVQALHVAYLDAQEDVPVAAERLWATLEFRCKAAVGASFVEVVL